MTRKERYEASLKAREEGKKKEQNWEKEVHPEYCTADKGTAMLIRPMTDNSELDPKKGTDHRFFYSSFLKNDEGKFFPFKWGFEPWYKHPIYKLVKKVAKYEYDSETKSRKYDNAGCELLADITHNGDITDKKTSGWNPQKVLLMNVIDRMDDWCKENKHSKVVTNYAEYDEENDRWKSAYGIKVSQYDKMCGQADHQMGSIVDFDFLTVKYKKAKKVGDKNEYYETILAEQSKPFIAEHYGQEYVDAIYEDYDEDEMGYEMYNFEEMDLYKASTIGYFLAQKSKFVKDVDAKYGTSFFDEFTALAKAEGSYKEPTKKDDEPADEGTEEAPETDSPSTDAVAEETKRPRRRSSSKSEAFDPKSLDTSVFKGIPNMTDAELANIVGVDGDTLKFADGCTLEPCDEEGCGHEFDVEAMTCPYCNASYE